MVRRSRLIFATRISTSIFYSPLLVFLLSLSFPIRIPLGGFSVLFSSALFPYPNPLMPFLCHFFLSALYIFSGWTSHVQPSLFFRF